MRCRRVEQDAILAATRDFPIPAAKLAGLMLQYWGTNEVGQTGALSDLGNILCRFRGIPIASISVETLFDYTQFKGGLPVFASVADAAFEAVVILPFRFGLLNTDNPDDNILNAGHNELVIRPDPVAAATFAAMNFQVSALLDYGVARYIVQIGEQTVTWTAQARPRLSIPNLKHLYISEPETALPNSVMLTSGQPSVVLWEDRWEALEYLTNLDNMVEAAVVNAILPDLGGFQFATWARGKYELQALGAVGTSRIAEFGALPVSAAEYIETIHSGEADLFRNTVESPAPPTIDIAPVDPRTIPIGTRWTAPDVTIQGPGLRVDQLGAASIPRRDVAI